MDPCRFHLPRCRHNIDPLHLFNALHPDFLYNYQIQPESFTTKIWENVPKLHPSEERQHCSYNRGAPAHLPHSRLRFIREIGDGLCQCQFCRTYLHRKSAYKYPPFSPIKLF